MKKISNSFYAESAATLPAEAAVTLIKAYKKLISPMFPPSCRFYPSCSTYSIEAFHMHGFFKGIALSIWRVLRCNPFNAGGYDPVREEHPFRRSKGK